MNMSREAHAIVSAINELTQVMKEIRDILKAESPPEDEAELDESNYIL